MEIILYGVETHINIQKIVLLNCLIREEEAVAISIM